jgi:hypothetical protein
MAGTTLNELIEEFGRLALDDKEYVVDILKRQLIEGKRDAIAKRAQGAVANMAKGKAKTGTVKVFFEELEK